MSALYNNLLLIIFVLVTVPAFCYWMGYRNGEKSCGLKIDKSIRKEGEQEEVPV